jgi:hypothetical protein
MSPTHIKIYINKLLSKLDQSKQEREDYMEGYRDGLAFAITAIREKELQVASPQGSLVASTKAGPKEIPFGQHLTCSQCQGACTDHYSVSNNIWCPECAEGRIKATGQHPSWLPTPQEVDQYMPPERRDYLHGKRAKLLERIQEIKEMSWPNLEPALDLLDLQDELAAVESELGYPEAQEPEEA